MKSKFQIANMFSVLVILAMLIAPVSTVAFASSPEKAQPPTSTNPEQTTEAPSAGTGLYIVRLEDAALASYTGGVEGLAGTSPLVTGSRFVDVSSPASAAYLAYLQGKQAQAIAAMEQTLGRSVEVKYQYLNVLNGMAVAMSAAEATRVSKLAGVLSVTPDTIKFLETEVSVDLIGAPNIWDGNTISAIGTKGEGVIVGVIDSGINHDHPSFAEVGGDGYVHTNPYGAGNSAPGSHCDTDPTFCNDKLVGAWDFNPGGNPEDGDGHGSHTASTSAGNYVTATITVGPDSYDLNLKGVAPHANIIAYKVCNPGCPSSASVAAVDQAITDRSNAGGVPMVMNYSISGSDNPWGDSVDLAFLDAFNAGILVSASAGNDGPGASTTAKTGGWNLTVGASTTNRVIANTLDVTGPGSVPGELTGLAAVTGSGPAITSDIEDDILWAGDVAPGNETGCAAFPANAFADSIALIIRGGCTFAVKVDNATAAGAVAVVVFNQFGGPPITMGALEATTIPAVMLDNPSGLAVQAWVSANPGATARINANTSYIQNPDWEDIMGGFSSRGPSQFNTLKPDVTAPGVNILAAYAVSSEYAFLQGTSMSSPHGAGSAALMMALHPDWSPAEIKSAIAMTALTNPAPLDPGTANVYKEDGLTPADWFDMGGGRIALGAAAFAGLVMDETYTNFVNANPALGGDPRTLNLHGLQDWECVSSCVFTRTVSSPLSYAVAWTVSVEQPAGVSIAVAPSSFTLAAGGSQELVITVDNSGAAVADWQFANVVLTPSEPVAAPVSSPVNVAAFDGPLPADAKDELDSTEAYVSVAAPLANYEAPMAVLYDNGPLVNSPGTGAGGADESMLQNSSLGMSTIGFGHQVVNNNWVADDFVVSDALGWTVDSATFYSYQTGAPVTSTITSVNWQVWDGTPGASNMIANGSGLLSTGWSNIYRVTETTSGATNRPVYATTVDLGGLNLAAGTYWLAWQTAGTAASGPWAPPITINGTAVTGNGLQSLAGGAYGPALDGGTGTPQQGFPFVLEGSVNLPPTATYCSAPNLAIPDNNPAGASDSIVIADASNIVDVNLAITATHTWVGDLIFSLAHTDTATSVTAIDRPGYTGTGFGCSNNNVAALLDDEGVDGPVEAQCSATPPALFGNPTPNNPLSAFDSDANTGTWTLTVSDNASGDTGALSEWCVTFEYGTAYVNPAPAHLAVAVFNPGAPFIEVAPDTLEGTQGIDQIVEHTLTISNTGTGDLEWSIFEDATQASDMGTWADDFESYVAGSNLHGQGGWKGWANDPNAGALVSTAQAFNGVNSVEITGASDLVHEYTNTSGQWTYVANIFIPDTFSGDSFFILMNQYDDAGATNNWSVQSHFQSASGNLIDDESGNTLPFNTGEWAEIRVLIDLDADQHWFYYNGDLLYTGVWNGYNSGAGTGSDAIAAVDLFANGASPVYYDDLALLAGLIPPAGGGNDACDAPSDVPWLSVSPASGVTAGPGAEDVTVTFDSTGLTLGVYTGTLCVTSNDLTNPLVTVPVTMTVDTLPPAIDVTPDALANTQGPDEITTWDMIISNNGEADLDWAIDEDALPNVLYSTVTVPSAAGTVTIGDSLLSLSANASGNGQSVAHTLQAPVGGATTITHSASQTITTGNSVSCNAGGLHADNSYVRQFTLADFGITDPFNVTEVSFGVEQATGATGEQPVTVNLYTWDPGDPFTWANFTLVGTAGASVPDQTLSIFTVPVTGSIPAGATLVVEVFTPDGQTDGNSFFVGSNADGQTAPSYLAAADCGIVNPVDTAAIGFPDMMIVMNVTGEIVPAAGVCVNPEDIAWASVNPISGTVAGGSSSTVEVTFDSTGLTEGVYTGTLCVTSNDLTNPLITVPLTLTVDADADLSITKTADAEVTVGDTFTYTVEVSNAGPAMAHDVVVTDTLPAGVTFVSATAGCTNDGGVVTCDLGDVASGGTATVEIVVTADEVGTVTNTAVVASSSSDPNAENNSASAETDIVEAPMEGYWIYLPLVRNDD